MTNGEKQFDVLVIGAGVGGLTAATHLVLAGYRPLLVEALDRLGGRASTREVDGFRLNTGAFAIERDGPIPTLLARAGVPVEFYVPKPDTVLLWGSKAFGASSGPVGVIRSQLANILRAVTAVPMFRPKPNQTTAEWVSRFTKSSTVHGLVDNVLGGFFAAAGNDIPAQLLIEYLTKGSAYRKLGSPAGGTVEVWNPLRGVIERAGGEVWLNSTATKLVFDGGVVTGAVIERDGEAVTVGVDAVISNAGPLNTVRIAGAENFPDGYAEDVERRTDGSAILTVHFASREPLVDWPWVALVGKSRRMTYAGNFSAPQQQQTKPGWFLYSAASSPKPARGDFDLESEKELLLDDVRDFFVGFDQHAQILAWDVTAHEWPAQRAVTGHDLPIETPVPNLWNVGDGVKIGADAGTAACARTAAAVVEQLQRRTGPRAVTSRIDLSTP